MYPWLIDLAERAGTKSAAAAESPQRSKRIKEAIDQIKTTELRQRLLPLL